MKQCSFINWHFGHVPGAIRQALIIVGLMAAQAAIAGTPGVFNIRDYGAAGDGTTLDTPAIHKAIEACAKAGGGQVLLPPGKYISGTVHLKSHVTLFLEAGATLVGTPDLDQYQQPEIPEFMPEARWGKWHRSLILGDGLEDIAIAGQGVGHARQNRVRPPITPHRVDGNHGAPAHVSILGTGSVPVSYTHLTLPTTPYV